jgi:hypothetical protein
MPASEAHHHAHAGGLLSHTIEMLLAAMTWRNAHLLPGGSQIEIVDAQRDQWTYVVFFCALLHDIAKPMTDLRIAWRPVGENDPIRWAPAGGSLSQIAGQRTAEYLVDFAPKGQRDYSAHAKLAQLLLPALRQKVRCDSWRTRPQPWMPWSNTSPARTRTVSSPRSSSGPTSFQRNAPCKKAPRPASPRPRPCLSSSC